MTSGGDSGGDDVETGVARQREYRALKKAEVTRAHREAT